MEFKIVYFGRTRTKQIKCPKCLEWQFYDLKQQKCCMCDWNLNKEICNTEKPIEYRSEITTWREKISDEKKRKVYEKDEFICQYCGVWCYESYIQNPKSLTIDHMTPWSGGGNNDTENLITSCSECNSIKNDKRFKTFEEAREYILKRKKYDETI